MSAFNTDDLKIEIKTILNNTGDPMETSNASPIKSSPQKNILEKSENTLNITKNNAQVHDKFLSEETSKITLIKRPHNLEDFLEKEVLEVCNLKSTFKFDELNKDEEIWVVDIPKTIDPIQLKNQILQLGDKSKFKVGDDRYCAINRDSKSSLTCVFNMKDSSKLYKTVNIKPSGMINVRRKLSGTSKKKLQFEKFPGVPYPQNIKTRHPFFGVKLDE